MKKIKKKFSVLLVVALSLFIGKVSANAKIICKAAETLPTSYGSINTGKSTLKTGDVFLCDLNGNGTYDERFYYVYKTVYPRISETSIDAYLSDYATLIYYKNVGSVTNYVVSGTGTISGPSVASEQLPSTSEWSNTTVLDYTNENGSKRVLMNEKGIQGNVLNSYYSEKAARLIEYHEINKACSDDPTSQNSLVTKCNFLFDTETDTPGYWLENYYSEKTNDVYTDAWVVDFTNKSLKHVDGQSQYGVRPIIEVKLDDIQFGTSNNNEPEDNGDTPSTDPSDGSGGSGPGDNGGSGPGDNGGSGPGDNGGGKGDKVTPEYTIKEDDQGSEENKNLKEKIEDLDKAIVYKVEVKKDTVKKIEFNIPEGFIKDRIVVYYVGEDGNLIKLDAEIVGDKIIVNYNKSGKYIIAELKSKSGIKVDNPSTGATISIIVIALLATSAFAINKIVKKKRLFVRL